MLQEDAIFRSQLFSLKKAMTNFLGKGFIFPLSLLSKGLIFFFLPILKCLSNHIKGIPFNYFFLNKKVAKLRMHVIFTISMK